MKLPHTLNIKPQTPDPKLQTPNSKLQKLQTPNSKLQTLNTKHKTQNTKRRLAERARWIRLAGKPKPARLAAVFFEATTDVCVARVCAREGRPTIPTEREGKPTVLTARGGQPAIRAANPGAKGIVRGFAKRLTLPSTSEGFGHVFAVRSESDASALAAAFCDSPPVVGAAATCAQVGG
jgi:hypothetical protein